MSEERTDIRLTRKVRTNMLYATLICLIGISNQLCFIDCREMKLNIVSVRLQPETAATADICFNLSVNVPICPGQSYLH